MVANLKYSLKCYALLVGAYLESRFVHKISPILHVFGLGCFHVSTFLGVWIILQRFDSIGTWPKGHIIFIYSFALISYALRCFFFLPFTNISQLVISGDFDRILVRPLNPIIHLMGNRFDVGSFSYLILGFAIFFIYLDDYGIVWTPELIFWFILALLSAGLIQGDITMLMCVLAFYIKDISGLNALYKNLRNFIWYPITLFNRVIQFILVFLFPLAFASFIPAGIFLSHEEYDIFPDYVWKLSLLVSVFLFAVALKLWKRGIKHYESSGS